MSQGGEIAFRFFQEVEKVQLYSGCCRFHPQYKEEVSRRLFPGAMQLAYEEDKYGPFQGPFPQSITVEARDSQDNPAVEIEFDADVFCKSANAWGFQVRNRKRRCKCPITANKRR